MSAPTHLSLAVVMALAAAGCGRDDAPAAASPPKPEPIVVRTGRPPLQAGPLMIDPSGFELGIVPPSTAYELVATIGNRSEAPMTITTAKSSCLCTVPEDLEGRELAPGESIPFSTSFESPATQGEKSAHVYLVFRQGDRDWQTSLRIKATVALAVRSTPPHVDALRGVTSGTVRVESMDGRPFRILSAYGQAPVYADGSDAGRDEPRSVHTLKWDVEYPTEADCAKARYWWVIETDHPDCPLLPLEIRHQCTADRRRADAPDRGWFFADYLVNLGNLKAGAPVEADVEIKKFRGRTTLRVDSAESLTPGTTAELVEVMDSPESDSTICRVRFRANRGSEGLLHAYVLLRTEAGAQELPFIARVVPR